MANGSVSRVQIDRELSRASADATSYKGQAVCNGLRHRSNVFHTLSTRRVSNIIGVSVCMYCHACSKSTDQPGKVANPARGQLNREN